MALEIFRFLLFIVLIIYPLGRVFLFQILDNHNFEITKSLTLGLLIICIFPKVLVILGVICWIYIYKRIKFQQPPILILPLLITSFALVLNSQILYPFGQITPAGVALSGAHFIDSTWHLALINNLLRGIPPDNPGFSGVILQNYHYFTDLQMAIVQSFTSILVEKIFFILMGPLYLWLTFSSVYSFIYRVSSSRFVAIFGILLIMCAGNWYYFAQVFYPQSAISPSVAWMDFYSSKVVNFPLLYSLALLFVILELVLSVSLKTKSIILLAITSGFLFMVKSHTAIVALVSLFIFSLFKLLNKQWSILLLSMIGGAIGYLLISSNLSGASSALIFNPLWFIRVMYESPFHLNTPDWELRRQFLLSMGSYFGVAKLYLQGLSFFMIINFALGLMGVVYYVFRFFKSTDAEKLLVIIFFVSLILTMSFTYAYSATVTIQFIYTAFISAQLLFLLMVRNSRWRILIGVLYWISLIPGVLFINNRYRGSVNQIGISKDQTEALVFIKALSPGVILASEEYWSGSFLAAYSGHPVYLGDIDIVKNANINPDYRIKEAREFFNCQDKLPNKVKYVFTKPKTCLETNQDLVKLFSNTEVVLYKAKL